MTTPRSQPDRQAIEEHLGSIHRCAEGLNGLLVLASFAEDPVTGTALVPMINHYAIGNWQAMTDCAMAWSMLAHRNVYCPLAVMRPDLTPGAKGGEADIVKVLGLCADFDDDDAPNWATRVPLVPTAILETSPRRFQCFYLFTTPLDPRPAKDLARRLQAHTRCDVGTADLSHVWRIGGTLNWPNQKKAKAGRAVEPYAVLEVPGGVNAAIDPAEQAQALPALSPPVEPMSPRPVQPVHLDDEELLNKMLHATNGSAVRTLWSGDWSAYPSQSEGDSALCFHLAFWCARDAVRIDRLFRQSGLMRENKWDARRGASTYGAETIARACAMCPDTYGANSHTPPDDTPPFHAGASSTGAASPEATTAEPDTPPFQLVTPPDSFITHYIHYAAMRTDAPWDAHEMLAFGILSALAGPFVTLPIATSVKGWRLVLWLLYLVNSTEGRKTTTLDLAVDVIRAVLGEAALIHWEGSPQGVLQRLQTRDGQASVFVRDEYAGLMAGMNRGGHLATLPSLLIKGYDGAVLENVRTRKHGPDGETHSDTDRVENPYLVQLAAAPWDAFVERATIDNVLDGFLPRFEVVLGSAAGRELPMLTEDIRAASTAVYDQAHRYAARAHAIQQVAFAPGLLARQFRLEQAYRKKADASVRPDAAGPSLKRLAETALKLAALLALEEDTGTILSIRDAHFLLAAQITDKWVGNALRVVEALGRTTFQRDCERVVRTIQQQPAGIYKSRLYRVHQRLRQRDFEEILGALDAQERITFEEVKSTGRGRPALLVRATTRKGAEE